MKFDSVLQQDVFNYLSQRADFHFVGYTGTYWFRTWPKGEDMYIIESKKPQGNKTSISATISIFGNMYPEFVQYGVELKIEMHMWGYQTDETVFQGWVESVDELEIILKAVGL